MRRFWIPVLLSLITTLPAPAAVQVTNVRFEQQGDQVIIIYDLSSDAATYAVTVELSTDGGRTYGSAVRTISGDVGSLVSPGQGRRIVWEARLDLPGYSGDECVFRVTAVGQKPIDIKPVGIPYRPTYSGQRHKSLAVLASTVIPGTGQLYLDQRGYGYFFLSTTLAAGGAFATTHLLYRHWQSRYATSINTYNAATTASVAWAARRNAQSAHSQTSKWRKIRFYTALGGITVWAFNILNTVYLEVPYGSYGRASDPQDHSRTSLALEFRSGEPTLILQQSFSIGW